MSDKTAFRNLEEKIRALEKERLTAEGKYKNILETIEDGYWEVDLQGRLTFFNDAFCRISRATRGELMGVNPGDFTDPGVSKRLYKTLFRKRSGRKTIASLRNS